MSVDATSAPEPTAPTNGGGDVDVVQRRRSMSVESRHREILRLTVLGWNTERIAAYLFMTSAGVRAVLRSPIAQARLADLQEKADQLTVNVPLRHAMQAELNGTAIEAVRLQRRIIRDDRVNIKTRSRAAQHIMDRVLFEKNPPGDNDVGIRTILQRLDEIDKQVGRGVWLVPPESPVSPEEERASGETSASPNHPGASGVVGDELDPLSEALRAHLLRDYDMGAPSSPPSGPEAGDVGSVVDGAIPAR